MQSKQKCFAKDFTENDIFVLLLQFQQSIFWQCIFCADWFQAVSFVIQHGQSTNSKKQVENISQVVRPVRNPSIVLVLA